MNYKIVSSGSQGNCVIIENLMIDCGIAYKDLEKYLPDIDYLFITHKHGDHLKETTYNRIRREYPHIKTMGNYEVAYEVTVDKIITDNRIKLDSNHYITPFPVPHDVICFGVVGEFEDKDYIYVTDSAGTKSWPRGKYDYLFIESNHDPQKVAMANKKKRFGYNVWAGAKRHTSTHDSKAFYFANRKSEDSEWIELHKSKRFY